MSIFYFATKFVSIAYAHAMQGHVIISIISFYLVIFEFMTRMEYTDPEPIMSILAVTK